MSLRRHVPLPSGLRVLVLDGHSRAAVESVQTLGRAGARVFVAAEHIADRALQSRFAHRRWQQPRDVGALPGWIAARHAAHAFHLIIPATETSLGAVRQLPEDHPARVACVVPGNAALDTLLDKERTRAHAETVGVAVPRTVLLRRPEDPVLDAPWPHVLKPVRSKVEIQGRLQGLAPEIVRDAKERARVLARWIDHVEVQEQEYVVGLGEGVEVLYAGGELRWHFGHRRLHEQPLTGGGSAYRASLRPSPAMLEATRRLLDPLDWHGVAMVEFKRTRDGRHVLMEVNPRLWGSLALALDCGVDVVRGLAAVATGMSLPAQPDYLVPFFTRSVENDVAWMKENLRADHGDPLLLTRPRLRSLLEPLRVLWGQEAWDHMTPTDVPVGRGILLDILRAHTAGLADRVARRRWRAQVRRTQGGQAMSSTTVAPRRVLVLCYGNICRSPVAGALVQKALPQAEVVSSGFHERTGRESPAAIQTVAQELGLDLQDHRSSQVNAVDVEQADLILLMDRQNHGLLKARFPEALAKARMLGMYAADPQPEIEDPYQMSVDDTRRILHQIRDAVDGLSARIRAPALDRLDALEGEG